LDMTAVALAAISTLGTIATLLFGYLKYRDDKRIAYVEAELARSVMEMSQLRSKLDALTVENRRLERERDQLQYRLDLVENLSDEQEKKIEKLQGNEATSNREIERLKLLLEAKQGTALIVDARPRTGN
jgi:septal ring factor EnvC (AmiA/AmiB activator)